MGRSLTVAAKHPTRRRMLNILHTTKNHPPRNVHSAKIKKAGTKLYYFVFLPFPTASRIVIC